MNDETKTAKPWRLRYCSAPGCQREAEAINKGLSWCRDHILDMPVDLVDKYRQLRERIHHLADVYERQRRLGGRSVAEALREALK